MLHADAGQILEQLGAEVAGAAHAPGAVVDPARLGPGRGDQVGHRLPLRIGADRDQEGGAEDRRHRLEGADRRGAALLVQVRHRAQVVAVELQQRVAVGGGAARRLHRDEAAAAGAVLHHDALVPEPAQLVGHQAQRRVRAAARGERGEQRHRLVREVDRALRLRRQVGGRGGADQGDGEKGLSLHRRRPHSAAPIVSAISPTPATRPVMTSPATTAPTPSGVPV